MPKPLARTPNSTTSEKVDAGAGALGLAADGGRNDDPAAVDLAEILDRGVDRPVLLDERRHDVVDRFEQVGVLRRQKGRKGQDVMAGPRLRFGRRGQEDLAALGGYEVDGDVDLLLGGPFLDELARGVVGARHPMVPEANRQ